MAATFGLTLLAWVFFRADSVGHAMRYLSEIFSTSVFTIPKFEGAHDILSISLVILFFIIVEWNGREEEHAIANIGSRWKRSIRWAFYYVILMLLFYLRGAQQEFIYFQF